MTLLEDESTGLGEPLKVTCDDVYLSSQWFSGWQYGQFTLDATNYQGCEMSPFGLAQVKMNSCSYKFSQLQPSSSEEAWFAGFAGVSSIVCDDAGDFIKIEGPLNCNIKIPAQSLTGVVPFAENAPGGSEFSQDQVAMQVAGSGIEYDVTFACEVGGLQDETDGTSPCVVQ